MWTPQERVPQFTDMSPQECELRFMDMGIPAVYAPVHWYRPPAQYVPVWYLQHNAPQFIHTSSTMCTSLFIPPAQCAPVYSYLQHNVHQFIHTSSTMRTSLFIPPAQCAPVYWYLQHNVHQFIHTSSTMCTSLFIPPAQCAPVYWYLQHI
jgi:hypothetical protein